MFDRLTPRSGTVGGIVRSISSDGDCRVIPRGACGLRALPRVGGAGAGTELSPPGNVLDNVQLLLMIGMNVKFGSRTPFQCQIWFDSARTCSLRVWCASARTASGGAVIV